jgi:hypothetical protein
MRLPSGLKPAKLTHSPCPLSAVRTAPVLASQMRAILSSEAVTMRSP